MPKPQTPFQWFGQDTTDRAAAQGHGCCGTRPGATRACSCAGTTPRPPWPRASPAGATGGSGRSSRRCGGAGGTFQEWTEHFDLVAVDRGHGPPRPVDRLVRAPPPGPGRDAALGPHLGRAARGLPVAGLAGRPGRARASRTAGGRRVTTAGPAPATASSTWSPRPSRRPAAARGPGRTCRAAASCPVALLPARRPVGGVAVMTRVRIRFAKVGKIRWTSHRDIARMWERAFRRVEPAAGLHQRLLAPAQGQLRAGPSHRPRIGGRVPRPRARRALADRRRRDRRRRPAGAAVGGAAARGRRHWPPTVIDDRAPSLQEQVSALHVAVGGRPGRRGRRRSPKPTWPPGSSGSSPPTRVVVTRQRKGTEVTDDIRPGIVSLRTAGTSRRRRLARVRADQPAAQPAAVRAGRRPRARCRANATCGGCTNGSSATARGGSPSRLPPAATTAPHALGRAS